MASICGLILAALLSAPGIAAADQARLVFLPPTNASEAGPVTYRAYLTPEGEPERPIELGALSPGAGGEIVALVTISSLPARVSVSAMGPGGESERSGELTIPARAPAPEAPDLQRVERLLEDALRELRK